jgi:hypothetical protein
MDEQKTQPTIETLMQMVAAFQLEVRERFDGLEKEMRDGFRKVDRKLDVLNQSLLEIRADQRYMDERITALEPK